MLRITRSGSEFRKNGERFRYIGTNKYSTFVASMTLARMHEYFLACKNRGIPVVRTWLLNNTYMPTNTSGNIRYLDNGELVFREAAFTQIDKLIYVASLYGITLQFSLADDPNYNTKNTYIRWSDAIYNTDFFTPVTRNVSSLVLTSGVVTGTTTTPHQYKVGTIITITGATDSNFNGTATMVRTVPTPTTFTYARSGDDATAAGTITVVRNSSFKNQEFYRDENCKNFHKEYMYELANHQNSLTNNLYKNEPNIIWELGNEMRYDQDSDPAINGSDSHNISVVSGLVDGTAENSWEYETSWAKEMADYMKSVAPDQLIFFGDMGHTWQFATGDTVSNGSRTGVDYSLLSAIDSIDALDFHMYPTSGVNLLKYGQRLGFPNSVSWEGLKAQIIDYVTVGKDNGKPVVCSELGFVRENIYSNTHITIYPRSQAFKNIFDVFFSAGGDGMIIWQGETEDSGSYTVNLTGWDGNTTNLNYNDRPLVEGIIHRRNFAMNGGRIPVI